MSCWSACFTSEATWQKFTKRLLMQHFINLTHHYTHITRTRDTTSHSLLPALVQSPVFSSTFNDFSCRAEGVGEIGVIKASQSAFAPWQKQLGTSWWLGASHSTRSVWAFSNKGKHVFIISFFFITSVKGEATNEGFQAVINIQSLFYFSKQVKLRESQTFPPHSK